jgi:hypothetical protein
MMLHTKNIRPPISTSAFDWIALTEEREDIMGHGATENEAIEHLLWLMDDDAE